MAPASVRFYHWNRVLVFPLHMHSLLWICQDSLAGPQPCQQTTVGRSFSLRLSSSLLLNPSSKCFAATRRENRFKPKGVAAETLSARTCPATIRSQREEKCRLLIFWVTCRSSIWSHSHETHRCLLIAHTHTPAYTHTHTQKGTI